MATNAPPLAGALLLIESCSACSPAFCRLTSSESLRLCPGTGLTALIARVGRLRGIVRGPGEWAVARLRGQVQQVGQPPVLGRVVERRVGDGALRGRDGGLGRGHLNGNGPLGVDQHAAAPVNDLPPGRRYG